MLLGVDVGGTFTDAVLAFEGRIVTAKAPSTPQDQSEGVMNAVRAVLERAGRGAEKVEAFAHGMTVATNALLEGRSARTALVATEGFTDLVALARQAAPAHRYALITDSNIQPLYAGTVESQFERGTLDVLTIPPGESNKTGLKTARL